jgi:hypothetical protein
MTEYRWYDLPGGRKIFRAVPKPMPERSSLPMPYVRSDKIDPVVSMADGKEYDSASALRRTYKADGNPQGVDYIEVGNESLTKRPERVRNDALAIEAIERAEADIIAGRAPKIGTADADIMASAKMIQI